MRRYERLAPGVWSVSEHADIPKSLNAQRAPHFYRLLREGKAAYGVLSSLSGPEKRLLEGMGVKSVLALPIVVRGHWHGIIAFSDTRNERAWQPGDIAFLQTAGEIIGAALERSQTELSLAESHQRAEEASRAKSLFLANTGTKRERLAARSAELIAKVKSLHSYAVPCIVGLAVEDGYPPFLEWVAASVEA